MNVCGSEVRQETFQIVTEFLSEGLFSLDYPKIEYIVQVSIENPQLLKWKVI